MNGDFSNVSHYIIPDQQIKPGVPLEHLKWAGEYAASKHPTRIINIGDGADLPSLSSYDVGKKSFEGRTYKADIEAFKEGMNLFMTPIRKEQAWIKRRKLKQWHPTLDYFIGNHEDRITRAIETDRKLDGLISIGDLGLREFGWNVHDFLEVRILDGIAYSHYFVSGVMGRPVTSARALVTKKHMSCVMGHVQKAEIDVQYSAEGRRLTGIFAGCFYQHDEEYLGPQTNKATWRGVWMLYNVKDGEFTFNNIPLEFLRKKFGS